MAIKNASLVTAPTSIAATGGTALAFTGLGIQNNSVKAVVTTDTDLRTRRSILAKVKEARPNPNSIGGYTMQRNSIKISVPKLKTLPSGAQVVANNYVMVEVGYDVETTPTEKQLLLDLGAQSCFDADLAPTLKDGSLD